MATEIEKYELRVYDKSDAQKAYVSGTALAPALLSAKFTLARIGGCTTMTFTAPTPGIPGTVVCGYLVEFWAKPLGGSLVCYWRGEIVECPNTGNTADVLEYRAVGLMRQLSDKLILQYYTDDDTDNIVTDLIGAEFTSDTDVDSGTGEVSIASPYALGDAEFEFITGAKALKVLAEAQKLVDYGVDEEGKVYFKDRDTTTVVERYWVGKHLKGYETTDNMDGLTNSLLLRSKEVVAGGELTIHKTDSTSITAYGERMKTEKMPHIRNLNDIYRMAVGMVADRKDPRTSVDADVALTFVDFQFPTGAVVVTDIDGNTATLPIQKTIYTLDESGFRGRFELGDEPEPAMDDEIKAIFQEIATEKESTISFGKIEHTRGEEFLQAARMDAGDQGNYNSWLGTFDSTRGIDQTHAYHIYHDAERGYVGNNDLNWTSGTAIQTFSIPLGPNPGTHADTEIDSIRLHLDQDWHGRIDFSRDDDITRYFDGSVTSYKLRTDYAMCEATANNPIYYQYVQGNVVPTEYNIRFGLRDMAAESVSVIYAGYNSAIDYIKVVATNGAATFGAALWKNVAAAGDVKVAEVAGLTKDTDYWFEVKVRDGDPGVTDSELDVYNYADALQGNDTGSIPAMVLRGPGVLSLYDGSVQSYLDFMDFPIYANRVVIWVSRDDGTTWTDCSINAGDINKTINISAQPIGTGNLLIKAVMKHPARLYGWGVSWKSA